MNIYVCIYVCIYVYIYMNIYMYIYIYICMYINLIYMCIYQACWGSCINWRTHIYTCILILHVYIRHAERIYIDVCILILYRCLYINTSCTHQACWADLELYKLANELMDKQAAACRL